MVTLPERERVKENRLMVDRLGYPRTINQAKLLDKEIKVDHVVALNVPNDEIVNRLKDRWVHAPSGRVYNLLWNPPKVSVRGDSTNTNS